MISLVNLTRPLFPANLVIFTGEIINEKLYLLFLCLSVLGREKSSLTENIRILIFTEIKV